MLLKSLFHILPSHFMSWYVAHKYPRICCGWIRHIGTIALELISETHYSGDVGTLA